MYASVSNTDVRGVRRMSVPVSSADVREGTTVCMLYK
jgi:hypothetical protein